MSTSNMVVGAVMVAGALQLAVSALVPRVDFLTVHDIHYENNGVILADRTINRGVVADWRVTVVPDDRDGPICNTVPGSGIHEGWSAYQRSPRTVRRFTIDEWVGDPGCYERLNKGELYGMYVAWTPRGEDGPVSYKITFKP